MVANRAHYYREGTHLFALDKVFGPGVPQDVVYNELARTPVRWISQGYNSTIFACTGSATRRCDPLAQLH